MRSVNASLKEKVIGLNGEVEACTKQSQLLKEENNTLKVDLSLKAAYFT